MDHTSTPVQSAQAAPSSSQITTYVTNYTTISEAYHLVGLENYGIWAFRMRNILKRNRLF